MKKLLSVMICFSLVFSLTGCGGSNEPKVKKSEKSVSSGKVLDLTKLSSTVVISEMQNITNSPEEYVGTKITVEGSVASSVDEQNGETYHACIVKDAAACCQQGIEFQLKDGDYPKDNEDVKITGKFGKYKIGENTYYTLKNAKIA